MRFNFTFLNNKHDDRDRIIIHMIFNKLVITDAKFNTCATKHIQMQLRDRFDHDIFYNKNLNSLLNACTKSKSQLDLKNIQIN